MCDSERNLYGAFHLSPSVKHTWDIKSQIWYAEQLCAGRNLLPMDDGDDPHQLGGDVIINSDGEIIMIHRSTFPIDRPTTQAILEVIRKK